MNSQTTIKQLGGIGKLKAMINAREFVEGDNYLRFKFSGSSKMNGVKIELTPLDEYKLTFLQFKPWGVEEVTTAPAWAGNLKRVFEDETGLLLSL